MQAYGRSPDQFFIELPMLVFLARCMCCMSPASFRMPLPFFAPVLALLLTVGCQSELDPPPRFLPEADTTAWSETGDTVVEQLENLDFALIDSAFAALPRHPLERIRRTDVFTPDGALHGQQTETWHHPLDDSATQVDFEEWGTLPDRRLGGFAPEGDPSQLPQNRLRDAYPEDPPFLEARKRSAYHYGVHRDTIGRGLAVDRIEIVARDTEDGRGLTLPYARVDVLPGTNTVIGTYVVRAERALLYEEDSFFVITLQPRPTDAWLPHTMRFRTRLTVPLRSPESVQSVTTLRVLEEM